MPMFRIKEAASLLGVSTDTLRRWADGGRITTVTDDSGRMAVDGAALAALAQELAESAGSARGRRFRFASLMSLAADDANLPADPEFRAAFVGYLEWGTRLAMHNSQTGADVAQQAPVPHWGWGVAPLYRP
jgi:excisionase family DNA binding protein